MSEELSKVLSRGAVEVQEQRWLGGQRDLSATVGCVCLDTVT